jgi:hypothetical protein
MIVFVLVTVPLLGVCLVLAPWVGFGAPGPRGGGRA